MKKPRIKIIKHSSTLAFVETVPRYGFQPQVTVTGPYMPGEPLKVKTDGKPTERFLSRTEAFDCAVRLAIKAQDTSSKAPGAFISG